MQIDIPRISGQPLKVNFNYFGDRLFIVGANGAGKSALLQYFVSSLNQKKKQIRRIFAYRQTWLYSGNINLTSQDRRIITQQIKSSESQDEARWKDQFPREKQKAVFFDLINDDDVKARLIYSKLRQDNPQNNKEISNFVSEFKKSKSLFEQLNELLALGTLAVSLEYSGGGGIFARHKKNGACFSIAEMSDGERNAVLIAAEVLTVKPSTFLLIDEPERHLHRAIIEPFLSALFKKRKDCIFIISTHETTLPAIDSEAHTLILRSCEWTSNKAHKWDAELLEADTELPEDLKIAILGAKKKVLFIEGTKNSLDQKIYRTLFPDTLVIPKGSCSEVEKAVKGLMDTCDHHNTTAFGLIDRDNRDDREIQELSKKNIFALDVYSVEALYYCSDTMGAVANKQKEPQGCKVEEIIKEAQEKAFDALKKEDLAERMVAHRCKQKIRNKVLSKLPDCKEVKGNQELNIKIDTNYNEEMSRFKTFMNERKLDEIFARYPIRESSVFTEMAKALKFSNKRHYEQAVVTQVTQNDELAQKLKERILPLVKALNNKPAPSTVS